MGNGHRLVNRAVGICHVTISGEVSASRLRAAPLRPVTARMDVVEIGELSDSDCCRLVFSRKSRFRGVQQPNGQPSFTEVTRVGRSAFESPQNNAEPIRHPPRP